MTADLSVAGPVENQISGIVIDAALEVHRTLGGPGRLVGRK